MKNPPYNKEEMYLIRMAARAVRKGASNYSQTYFVYNLLNVSCVPISPCLRTFSAIRNQIYLHKKWLDEVHAEGYAL